MGTEERVGKVVWRAGTSSHLQPQRTEEAPGLPSSASRPRTDQSEEPAGHPFPSSFGTEEPSGLLFSASRPRTDLPEDLWLRILSLGVRESLGLRELCSLSMCSRKFRTLCATDGLWREMCLRRWEGEREGDGSQASHPTPAGVAAGEAEAAEAAEAGKRKQAIGLTTAAEAMSIQVAGLPLPGKQNRRLAGSAAEGKQKLEQETPAEGCASWKAAFQKRFEREKLRQLVRHRRRVLRAQSKAEILRRDIAHTASELEQAKERLAAVRAGLASVRQMRSASSAVKIWQPHTVVRRHEQFLEQATVSPEAQALELEQELQDCLLQIRVLTNSRAKRREALQAAEKEVEFLTFKPT